ncbi:MAG: formate--tetrahydrofolate ligase [Thermoguttaceae bacterium]|nr:formate--tetrahydrofolate ligase [Thermoguttaceae bacterium]
MATRSIPSDIEIARNTQLRPITEIAAKLGIPEDALENYGKYKAKVSLEKIKDIPTNKNAKLILVTAINPTPAGEGKTTVSVGLCDALNLVGRKACLCLREPSLGPCFGVKGGAAGGGFAQIAPMEDINLHFTGDFHAITAAHNLLAAMVDNSLHQGNPLRLDSRKIVWGRTLDVNERALRSIVLGLGGTANSVPRESFFIITAASEIMAIFCLSDGLFDLRERLGKIVVGYNMDGKPVSAMDIKARGAMTVLLKEAINPNLVQTLEGSPAFVHGGPFANIAHGCNSVAATKTALKFADYIVTEAGFGADLGAEKFFDVKCRKAGLAPNAAVVVATVRALKCHGGVAKADLGAPDVDAVLRGAANLERHVQNVKKYGVPVVVALNKFEGDSPEEIQAIEQVCEKLGVKCACATHWSDGGKGAVGLAQQVIDTIEENPQNTFKPLYDDSLSIKEKIETVAREIYHAGSVSYSKQAERQLAELVAEGCDALPVCIAKTQYSFSADPKLLGAPEGFELNVRELRWSAGAGFVVVMTGEIIAAPGLPKVPAAEFIDVNENGDTVGLF